MATRKRAPFTVTLADGPTVTEPELKLFLALERDGIHVTLDPDGLGLTLAPIEKVHALPYIALLAKHKQALLALTKYVATREAR